MTYFLYILIVLIVLTLHEYGHLVSAQMFGIRISRLQIGFGPSLFTRYTGRTKFALAPDLPPLPVNRVIDFIAQWASDDEPMTILAWRAPRKLWRMPPFHRTHAPQHPTIWSSPPERTIAYCGKIRETNDTHASIATVAWAVAPIPIAAFVALPEAPGNDVPHCYNTTSWRTRSVVILTGVAANVALFIAVTLSLPLLENPSQIHQQQPPTPSARTNVPEETPYHLRVADTTMRYYQGFRSATQNLLTPSSPPPHYPRQFTDTPPICGPICASKMTGAAVDIAGAYGWVTVLGIVTIITAALNLLPVPPLDGWKMMLNTAQAVRRKPFNPTTTMAIEMAALAFIILIALFILALDLHHLFT